jgi:hypothetical protein
MADLEATYSSFASAHGLEPPASVQAAALTPLLVESKHCRIEPAARGTLPGGAPGVVGHLAYKRNKNFRFNVVLTEVPGSTQFAPRVFCVRRGRSTRDDEFCGFEARHSKLWTESLALNERYAVTTSPFQDANWLRQLFSPALIDWLSTEPPDDFSFELCYGALLGSIEEDHPDAATLEALCRATSHVADRIRSECAEAV